MRIARNRTTLYVALGALLAGCAWFVADAQAAPPRGGAPSSSPPGAKSLDQQLLDDLQADLLEGVDDLPPPSAAKKDSSTDEPPSPLDQQLLDQLGEGEDIELGRPSDPLTRIGRKMTTVEQLLRRLQLAGKTQRLQQEIIDDLAALIERQRQQCAAGACSGAKQGQPRSSASQTAGRSPAADSQSRPQSSVPRVDRGEPSSRNLASQKDFYKQLWGQLPERLQQQLQNVRFEHFLPKYEKLIEDYYQRLAENAPDGP